MALFAKQVPEDHWEFLSLVGVEADLLGALDEEVFLPSHHGDAREISLHVGAEHRHARVGKAFGEDLQRHRLAGAGCARHQTVAIPIAQQKVLGLLVTVVRLSAGAQKYALVVGHYRSSPSPRGRAKRLQPPCRRYSGVACEIKGRSSRYKTFAALRYDASKPKVAAMEGAAWLAAESILWASEP